MTNHLEYSACASWLEISQIAFQKNIKVFRDLANDRFKVGVVLKGNAYGHGTQLVLSAVHSLVDCIYVITPQDAFTVRNFEATHRLPEKQVLVMGALDGHEIVECGRRNIEVAVSGPNWEELLENIKNGKYGNDSNDRKVKIQGHVHIDTGLTREGFAHDRLDEESSFLSRYSDILNIKGVMSHFANTEDVTEQEFSLKQIEVFEKGAEELRIKLGYDRVFERHIAASAAVLVLPAAHFDFARVGISLYGFWPSSNTRISAKIALGKLPSFTPALTWKCNSQLIKKVKKGSFVGYGCTFRAEKEMAIGVFPVGYFDGYPRTASGKSHVLIKETRCPIIGRVMMNHIIVDVTGVWDKETSLEAILIGKQGSESITAESLADWCQTIHYEVVTRIGPHLKRTTVD